MLQATPWSALIALLAALGAVASALYAHGQIQQAKQQNIATQQQQLLTLVTDIVQQPVALSQATANLKGFALVTTQGVFRNELDADGQAAATIITALRGEGQAIAAVEYVEVAKAFENTGDNAQAIAYLAAAVGAANKDDPDDIAFGMRAEASLHYSIGDSGIAHQEYMQAVMVFKRLPHVSYVTRWDADNGMAQSYLNDASSQIAIGGCQTAHDDLISAEMALAPLGSKNVSTLNQDQNQTDQAAYNKQCKSSK
jgi:hypothetical protein